ncbi:DUF3558 domain-containing protein [Streptomyces albipurpureus]|uniref:DUF3558 domain-containing protein n=1 Tax=Streptomyces albipurpureus TaxID=2897419 RepID=A0ABT0UZK5_9ACTN|nr:DUF3558 domain-containing protein [Streptomyces sp. CWNU-1]MCM2394012.1 DUF3558 domain-containing protein [Streptomyces sp. CWNU-1]
MHRTAPRLARILACAAVPVMLVASGCSSDSDGKPKAEKSQKSEKTDKAGSSGGAALATPESEKKPAVAPVKFTKLPEACRSLKPKTIEKLVPSTKAKAGTPGRSTDLLTRGSCSWNGLDDNGVKGSQYRWLDVSFLRFESDAALGTSGKQRAQEAYTKEVAKNRATTGAKNVKAAPSAGVGEEATALSYQLRKTGEDFSYVTIVTRTDNILITLTYNGTGYAGAKPPAVADLLKDAVPAVKETVTSVTAANK